MKRTPRRRPPPKRMEIFTIAGSKGGKASAAALTPAERRAKALKAVAAREAKRKTKCEAEDEVRLALR